MLGESFLTLPLFFHMVLVSEPDSGNHVGGQGHGDARPIGLVQKVPNVYSRCLSNKNDTGTAGTERTAGVVGIHSVRGPEHRKIGGIGDLPKSEVEVMHCQNQIIEERWTCEWDNRPEVPLGIFCHTDIIDHFGVFSGWLDGPVN